MENINQQIKLTNDITLAIKDQQDNLKEILYLLTKLNDLNLETLKKLDHE